MATSKVHRKILPGHVSIVEHKGKTYHIPEIITIGIDTNGQLLVQDRVDYLEKLGFTDIYCNERLADSSASAMPYCFSIIAFNETKMVQYVDGSYKLEIQDIE